MNPIARYIGQAEAEIGGATRRLVDSVTDPVRAKGHVMVAEASAAASRIVKLVVIKAALGIVAAAMAIVTLVYLAGALQQALMPHLGPVETRLVMALVFLVVAAAAGLAMAFWPSAAPEAVPGQVATDARIALAKADAAASEATAKAREKATEAKAKVAAATDTAASQARGAAAEARDGAAAATDSLRSGVESLAGVLGAAGFRREQAGLRAGLLLANQLKPMQIVSLALIGGFLAGMRGRR